VRPWGGRRDPHQAQLAKPLVWKRQAEVQPAGSGSTLLIAVGEGRRLLLCPAPFLWTQRGWGSVRSAVGGAGM
jgi:hypothetical protein